MRAMFLSKFDGVQPSDAVTTSKMLTTGRQTYVEFLYKATRLSKLDTKYYSLPELYDKLEITPHVCTSKRAVYSRYKSGVVIGAGQGDECNDLITDENWKLFDLQDERMINLAIGHSTGVADVALLHHKDGSTLTPVDSEYVAHYESMKVDTIDGLNDEPFELLAADVEGAGLDVLYGAIDTLTTSGPDVLISIYHNWLEYLYVIPFLYELGYTLHATQLVPMVAGQPHLDLAIFGTKK